MADDAAPLAGNPNRKDGGLGEDDDWVSGIDAALSSMSVGSGAGAADAHPEKRLKAVSFRGEGRGSRAWRGERRLLPIPKNAL